MAWSSYLVPKTDADQAETDRIVAESRERIRIENSDYLAGWGAIGGYAADYITSPKTYADEVATANVVLESRERIATNNENGAADALTDLGSKLLGTFLSMNSDTSDQTYPVAYRPEPGGGLSPMLLLVFGGLAAAAVYVVSK